MNKPDSTSCVSSPESGVKTTKCGRHARKAASALSTPNAARRAWPKSRRQTPDAKAGFSLIEVLVVIGLIAFLTAAVVVVMPRVANASKVAATRATIKKVDELLNDRINGFVRWIQTQNTVAAGNPPSYIATQYLSLWPQKQNQQLCQFLSAKIAFQSAFPQNFSEAGTKLTPTNPSMHKQVTESAACLYLILTTAGVFDTEPPAAGDLRGLEVADTDGDGLLEIVDAWGNPLQFYRWPTRLFRPVPPSGSVTQAQFGIQYCNNFAPAPAPTPASILVPDGPRPPLAQWTPTFNYSVGAIIQPATIVQGTPTTNNVMMYTCTVGGTSGGTEPTWGTTAGGPTTDGGVTWQASLDPLAIDSDDPNGLSLPTQVDELGTPAFPPLHTWGTYHVTLIVSAGTDGALGLYQPWDYKNFGTLAQPEFDTTTTPPSFARDAMYDNITNHQK
jgi:prepilin-type N-terminal cleavage/methylation domain-containing protein